ncbi:MAG: hypothetical protein HOG03_21500 [Desulfobacula sp.]|uniref:hypothetical protein n=1 Tax=Desulfobacula sp. TaxID=2593537 RepID=UPI001EC599DB|nr:hypothetical protein [Desulfobacula sp.]
MKSKKWLVKVAFAIFMVMAFSFQANAKTVWKMQHSWGAAENHFFEHYAKIVNEMSNGEIEIKPRGGELTKVKVEDAASHVLEWIKTQ